MSRILVVDDQVDAADGLGMLLDALGHETEVAYQGADAVSVTQQFAPHIVFMDLNMPILDGFAAALAIRATDGGSAPFLIALSGLSGADTRARVEASGFDAYIQKPADTNALLAIVQYLAERRRESPH